MEGQKFDHSTTRASNNRIIQARRKTSKGDNIHGKNECCEDCKGYLQHKPFMVSCDGCKKWLHGSCVGLTQAQRNIYSIYYCRICVSSNGVSQKKKRTNNWTHDYFSKKFKKDIESGTEKFVDNLKNRPKSDFKLKEEDILVEKQGFEVTQAYLTESRFRRIILVKNHEGLQMTRPDKDFSFKNVVDCLGAEFMMTAIDVPSQRDGMSVTLEQFVSYLDSPCPRDCVMNVINCHISGTSLENMIIAPGAVRDLSWDNKLKCPEDWLKTPNFCILSSRDSYTDFHVDFGGTGFWCHVAEGEKVFIFIEPTEENLVHFENWRLDPKRSTRFLGDELKCCWVAVEKGYTVIVPSGWIHAVLTTRDTIMFGSNFFSFLGVKSQCRINAMEVRLDEPEEYRIPHFYGVCCSALSALMQQVEDDEDEIRHPAWLIEAVSCLYDELTNCVPVEAYQNDIAKLGEEDHSKTLKFAKYFLKREYSREVSE